MKIYVLDDGLMVTSGGFRISHKQIEDEENDLGERATFIHIPRGLSKHIRIPKRKKTRSLKKRKAKIAISRNQ